jgi:hypothetical protein
VVTAVLPSATISTPHGVPLNSSLSLGQPITIQSSDPDSCDPPRPSLVTTLTGLTPPLETAPASCGDAARTIYTTMISGTPNAPASQLPGGVFPGGGLRVPATINLVDVAGNTTPVVLVWTLTNTAPSVTVPANQTLHAGAVVPANLNASATDLNNDPVTLTVTTTPALPGGTISASAPATNNGTTTVQFTGVAPPPGTTAYTTTITADDGVGGTTSSSFTWTVTNTAPTIRNPGSRFSQRGTPIVLFNLIGADTDGDPLTFSATGLPAGITVTPTGLVSGIPTTDGTYTVVASVTDGWATASTTFMWRVGSDNRPPE